MKEISRRNDDKIKGMTQQEVKAAVDQIHQMFSPQALEVFKKIANQQQSLVQKPVKIEYEEEKISTKQTEKENSVEKKKFIHPPKIEKHQKTTTVENKESEKIEEVPSSQPLSECEIFIHQSGNYKLGKKESLEPKSFLLSDLVNTEEPISQKYFSTNDLIFLLHSSYIPHRMLSLSITSKFLSTNMDKRDVIWEVMLEKDIFDAVFNVLHSSSGVTLSFQLKVFSLLHLFMDAIWEKQENGFEIVQNSVADENCLSYVWLEHRFGSEMTRRLYQEVIKKYDVVLTIVNFLINQEVDAPEGTPEENLTNIFIDILDKLLSYSKETIKVVRDNQLMVSLVKCLFKRNEIKLLQTIWKTSSSSSSTVWTIWESTSALKDDYLNLPSEILKMLTLHSLTENSKLQKFIDRLTLAYLMKLNGKWVSLFKTSSHLPEYLETLKLLPSILTPQTSQPTSPHPQPSDIYNHINSQAIMSTVQVDRWTIDIMTYFLKMLRVDRQQGWKDWAEDSVKKLYGQIHMVVDGIYPGLIDFVLELDTVEDGILVGVLNLITVFQEYLCGKYFQETFDVAEKVLERNGSEVIKKAVLYLVRRIMCTSSESLLEAHQFYVKYYSDLDVKEMPRKLFWHPLKLVLLNFVKNFKSLTEQLPEINMICICKKLMDLLVPQDEYALMEVLSLIFKDDEDLKTFFLGYCLNNKVATELSKKFYELDEYRSKIAFWSVHKNPYLPLEDNWFTKPVEHVQKVSLSGDTPEKIQLKNLSLLFSKIIEKLWNPGDLRPMMPEPPYAPMIITFISQAHLSNHPSLVTSGIVSSLSNLSEIPSSNWASCILSAWRFIDEFGFTEEGSTQIAKSLVHMETTIGGVKQELTDIWHLVEEVASETDH
jgi:hypothetical protein